MVVTAKVWTLNKMLPDVPELEDFTMIEENLPNCGEGEVIIEAKYLSVDPYMRYRLDITPVNTSPIGSQVAKVIESKNADFPVGTDLMGYPGWRSHTLLTKKQLDDRTTVIPYTKIPYVCNYPLSTALGILGLPGLTAYFGILEILNPKEGETVLVNAAAGAVGSTVCQILKLKGCKVIAFAGTDEKVDWVKKLGADYAFNYKKVDVAESIRTVAPRGIDCYFDNVGGEFTTKAVTQMANYGRVALCGAISIYNQSPTTSPFSEKVILVKQLRVEGFLVYRWLSRWLEGITQIKKCMDDGKLKYRETITKGFEKMPEAFIGLFNGTNIGKAIVEV